MFSGIRFTSKEEADDFQAALFMSGGFSNVAGVDDCGGGPFAGPVVAACVLLPPHHGIEGIKDSKKLSADRREKLSEQIMDVAYWGIGVRSNEDIDSTSIREATYQAAAEAATKCIHAGAPIDYLLCDGGLLIADRLPFPSTAIIKGDSWFESIGAASIIGKVYRDYQMSAYHEVWPEYGFDTNHGYGTKFHQEAIQKYGLTSIHRRTYGLCRTTQDRDAS